VIPGSRRRRTVSAIVRPVPPESHEVPAGAALVSPAVARRWISVHGEGARGWIEALPTIADQWAAHWDLALHGPIGGGSVSVVLAVEVASKPAVLKLAAPWSEWSRAEAAALSVWSGSSAPELLACSNDGGALLMERVMPGTSPDGLASAAVGDLLTCLSSRGRRLPPEIPPLANAVVTRFRRAEENRHGLMDMERLHRAKEAACGMAAELSRGATLLHGDFLRKNVLCSTDGGIVAIDPNPAVGDQCYDAAQWAVTEYPIDEAPDRCAALARHLGLEERRIWAWALVLGAVEICLASEPRARETLSLVAAASPAWW